jgi:hypothetical protein
VAGVIGKIRNFDQPPEEYFTPLTFLLKGDSPAAA